MTPAPPLDDQHKNASLELCDIIYDSSIISSLHCQE